MMPAVSRFADRPGLSVCDTDAERTGVQWSTPDGKAAGFEEHRAHLRAVAYRMLGSLSEADDAVQEAWIRFDRTDTHGVANCGAG